MIIIIIRNFRLMCGVSGVKKKIIILYLCIIGLMGCTNKDVSDVSEYNMSENDLDDESVSKLTLTDMRVQSGYSDGYAWLRLSSEEYPSLNGIVNKEGEVIAAIPTGDYIDKKYEGHSEFEDGYAFLFFDTEVHVLDTNGDIISTQKIGEDNQLAAYGSGYIVIENHIHDFDHNSYEYIFYNPNGEEVTKYVPEEGESEEVVHMGGGVFCFDSTSETGDNTNDIYFSKTNKWIQKRIGNARNDVPVTFGKSDKRVISCHEDGEGGILTIIDKDGNVTEHRLSIKPENTDTIIAYSLVSNNYCLLVDGDSYFHGDSLSVLDLDTGKQIKMSDTYFNKVTRKVDWYSEFKIYFNNDVFSVPLWGDDGEFYIGLFDMNCNLLFDPIRVDSYSDYSFSDGRLVIRVDNENSVEVYSVNGQKIYTVNEQDDFGLNDDVERKYTDGVFIDITSELGNIGVYDLDGDNLYTTLNTSDTKILLL